MLVSAVYNPKIGKVFSKFYHVHWEFFFLLMLIYCLIENSSWPCFVFCPVFFLVLRKWNWFLYSNCILLKCVHVFVYLGSVIHVDRERSGSEVARVLDPRQSD